MPKDDLQVMRDLMEAQREGFALPRHFYTSEAVYENDIRAFLEPKLDLGRPCKPGR